MEDHHNFGLRITTLQKVYEAILRIMMLSNTQNIGFVGFLGNSKVELKI